MPEGGRPSPAGFATDAMKRHREQPGHPRHRQGEWPGHPICMIRSARPDAVNVGLK